MADVIVVSTHNKGKIREMEEIVKALGFEIATRDEIGIDPSMEIKEDGETFEENSYKKAYEIMKLCSRPTMADDSGLMVDALNGEPGVYSSRYGGIEGDDKNNIKKLLHELEGVPYEKRTARFETVITLLFPDGEKIVCRGECRGHISLEPMGDKGFGYDPVFIPDGYEETFGQLGPEVKNQFSHRSKALAQLKEKLENRNNK